MLINSFPEWGGQLSRLLQRDGKQVYDIIYNKGDTNQTFSNL